MKKEKAPRERKIQFFSEDTQRLYQLFPTKGIPTLKISGVPMHRHTKIDPLEDTMTKVVAVKPRGIILDTCTGLGYTAIYSAKNQEVEKVITIERDENVAEIAKMNIASAELFDNKKIDRRIGDSYEEIVKFAPSTFDIIIHDPPTFTMSPDLYTERFYKDAFRVLKSGGRLWHYCPAPGKLKGDDKLRIRTIDRLIKAGFRNVFYDEKSSGITADKQ